MIERTHFSLRYELLQVTGRKYYLYIVTKKKGTKV